MKLNFLLLQLPVFAVLFFNGNNDWPVVSVHALTNDNTAFDSTSKIWVEDFKLFRDAVYRNDTAKVKSFFKFPLLNAGSEIWYLVLTEKELEKKNISYKKNVPFTANDFNRYYKKLFPPAFVRTVLKIKSEMLYKNGETETPEFKDESPTTVRMYASFDKATQTLSLNLASNTIFKDENGETLDGGESSVIYSFRVLKNGHLQFFNIRLAG